MAEIIRMPKLSDTMTEGVVAEWHKKTGDRIKSGDLLADIETDKATMEFESFQDGVLLHIGVEKGKTAPVDSILAILGKEGEDISTLIGDNAAQSKTTEPAGNAPKAAPAPVAQISAALPAPSENGRIKSSPLARALAAEKGISLEAIAGTGPGGRIVKDDIQNAPASAPRTSPFIAAGTEGYTEEPVSQMRKTIARRLCESKFTAPHFYLTISIDMDNAIAARLAINEKAEIKISFNDLVIKAAAMALKKNPRVNCAWLGDRIRYNQHVHIGVAVAVEDGLLVPVVRHADMQALSTINALVKDAADKARTKKLQPQDWEGNTFTISNLGMFGIEEFTAIINPPDACIMAVGGISQVPVVKNDQVVPGNVMKVTLSCDHRAVDGSTGAAFLQTFKAMLENPVMMLA